MVLYFQENVNLEYEEFEREQKNKKKINPNINATNNQKSGEIAKNKHYTLHNNEINTKTFSFFY